MDKWFEWIKKHWFIVTLICIFLILGVPFLIHIFYKIPASKDFWVSDWESGNLLEFYGSMLGFISTVILSLLALWQNEVIKKESEKREELLEKMEVAKHLPLLKCSNLMCDGSYENLCLELENVSDNLATDIEVTNFTATNIEGQILTESKSVRIWKTSLVGRDKTKINFINNPIKDEKIRITMGLSFNDKFLKPHTCTVVSEIQEKFTSNIAYKIIEIY